MNSEVLGVLERQLHSFQSRITFGLAFIVIFSLTMMGVVVFLAYQQGSAARHVQTEVQQLHGAVCALRADVTQRRNTSVNFLERNPEGIPGLPASEIQTSIDNYNRTISALSGVRCP